MLQNDLLLKRKWKDVRYTAEIFFELGLKAEKGGMIMKTKIQIKSTIGRTLFEYEKENNTFKDTVDEAVKSGANLRGANLFYVKNVQYIPFACPSDGAFIAWKKVEGKLVKLYIPEDAKRSSATTNKCRCDKAKVLSITDLEGNNPIDEVLNTAQNHQVLYKVGEMVYPDSFDEDRWNECSHGIHFFINKQEAINY